jgi:hypothetical protein
MATQDTVRPTGSRRRVVRRRQALDVEFDQALPDLPPDLRVAIQLWVEARSNEWSARSALSES